MAHSADFNHLLSELDAIAKRSGGRELTRDNVVLSLQIIARLLNGALPVDISEIEPGVWLSVNHSVAEHIRMLADAISDLDFGLTSPLLKPSSTSKSTAKRPADLREKDRVLCEALLIFKQRHRIATLKEAARRLSRELTKNGYRRRGQQLTGLSLLRIYNNYYNSMR